MKKIALTASLLALPVVSFAQELTGLQGWVRGLAQIINLAVPIIFTLAVLAFFWGLALYIFSADKSKGKDIMIWGIIALFVMVSVWGIINFIQQNLGIEQTRAPNVNILVPSPTR